MSYGIRTYVQGSRALLIYPCTLAYTVNDLSLFVEAYEVTSHMLLGKAQFPQDAEA